jgi:hypothetical protein
VLHEGRFNLRIVARGAGDEDQRRLRVHEQRTGLEALHKTHAEVHQHRVITVAAYSFQGIDCAMSHLGTMTTHREKGRQHPG